MEKKINQEVKTFNVGEQVTETQEKHPKYKWTYPEVNSFRMTFNCECCGDDNKSTDKDDLCPKCEVSSKILDFREGSK